MSFRGGYRGGRGGGGGGRRDDSFRGRGGGGGFKSKFGGSKFDKPSFSKGRDRFGGGRPDRGNDFRRSRQDDFRGDSGFRGSSPKRFRGDSGMNGGYRDRSFKDFSPREDSFDRGNRLDFGSRKSRGGRASFRSAPPPSRSSRGGLRCDSGFTTKSGFISKKKDFPRKFVRGSSKREYFGRLKSIRYRSKFDDDGESRHLSDDELRDEEEEEMEVWEYLGYEGVDEEDNEELNLIEDEEGKEKDGEEEQPNDKKAKNASDKQESDSSDKKKTTQKRKVSSSDAKKKESVTSEEDEKSSKSAEGTKPDSAKDTSSVCPDDKATSDSKEITVKQNVVKKVIKVTKKPSSESLAKSDKDKEKKDKTSDDKEDKDETSSDDGETLKCPHCHFESGHVRVYLSHLKSKSHLLVMDKLLTAWKYKIKGIRINQRKKQVLLDREARQLNLATFNCFICKLNYKTLKSEHLSSQPHRMLKKLLMPQCRICNLNFKSPVLYDAHICYIGHLRKKAKLEAELGTEVPNENFDLLEEEDDEVDPGEFMVVDAAESGDDCADEVENDDEKSQKGKKSKTLVNIGAEMCKKVEIYYCELCDMHLTRPLGKIEEALTNHCRHPKHLGRFYRHRHRMNKRLEEQQSKEKVSGEKEAKKIDKKKKRSVGGDGDNKDDVSLNSPADAHIIEGEDEEEHVDDEEHFDDEEEQINDCEEGYDEVVQDEEEDHHEQDEEEEDHHEQDDEEEDHHEQDDDEIEEDMGEEECVEEEEDSKYKEASSGLKDLLDEAQEELAANSDGDDKKEDNEMSE